MLRKTTPLLAILPFLAFNAYGDGYLYDSVDSVVTDGSGDCVYTHYWTPQDALVTCADQVVTVVEKEPVVFAAMEPVVPTLQQVTLDVDTYFEFDQATLKPAGEEKLNDLIQILGGYDELLEVHITGHADRIGAENYNRELAYDRASTVMRHLVENSALNPDLLTVFSRGEDNPQVSCEGMRGQSLIDCLAPNRRVDIDIRAAEAR